MKNATPPNNGAKSSDTADLQELYRLFFEEASDAIFITDSRGKYIAVSPQGNSLTGYSPQELLSMSITDLIVQEDLVRLPLRMDELIEGNKIITERLIRHKDGRLLPVEISSRMLPDGRILGIVRDISERKRTQEALQASEEVFFKAFHANPSLMAIRSLRTGRFLDVNETYCRVTGYSREELINEDSRHLGIVEPIAVEKVRQIIGSQGYVNNREEQFRTKAGEVHTGLFSAVVITIQDEPCVLSALQDISDRKQAQETQARLTDILENTSDLVATATPEGSVTYINKSGRLMIGLNADEPLNGRNITDCHAPSSVEQILQKGLPEAMSKGIWKGETVLRHRDGRHIPVSQVILAHRATDGTVQYYSTVMRDISERKQAEEDLRISEARFKAQYQGSPIPTFTWQKIGESFILQDFNNAALKITQGEASRFVGITAQDMYRERPDILADMEYCLRNKTIIEKEIISEHFIPGRLVKTTYAFVPPDSILVHAEDITERRQMEQNLQESEQLFKTAFYTSPDAVNINRLSDGLYIDINEGFTNITGFTRQDVTGKKSLDIHIWNNPADREKLVQGLKEKGYYENLEALFRRKDGSIITGLMSAKIIELQGIPHILSITRNISDMKQAELERNKLREQLIQAQKMESVGRLAGGVAHDFNNILAAILGHADLALMRSSPDEPVYNDLKAIEKSARRSADLIRQLLAFARKQTITPVVLDLNETVEGMLKMLRRLIGEEIDFSWKPAAGLWPVKIDPSQFDQLLANLCVNARDAIAGVGKIIIETENAVWDDSSRSHDPDAVPGEYVMLALSDTGCGMNEDVLDHIFEPFFTTKGIGEGTGLGLSTVYGIVKQNEGFIRVYSEPGAGTTFRIYLPRYAGKVKAPSVESTVQIPRGRGETILLVEDDAEILEVGKEILKSLGYNILTAGRPTDALRQARDYQDAIHLLITDVVMPEMNGPELAKMLDGIRPGLKCLFVSGYTADVIAHRGILEEGIHFLQKPFNRRDLAFKVRQILEQ